MDGVSHCIQIAGGLLSAAGFSYRPFYIPSTLFFERQCHLCKPCFGPVYPELPGHGDFFKENHEAGIRIDRRNEGVGAI